MRKVELDDTVKGGLYLHSMPGRFELWKNMLKDLADNEVQKVVCLTSEEEIERYSPKYLFAIRNNQFPFEKVDMEISDFGTPEDEAEFFEQVRDIAEEIKLGKHVLVHCAAGIGRTGMFASSILQALGEEDADNAMERVRNAGSSPETTEQRNLVSRFSGENIF